MEVKIGVQHAPRELTLELDDASDAVETAVTDAVSGGTLLVLTDSKGRRTLIPGDKISYVEIGGGVSGQVGFR